MQQRATFMQLLNLHDNFQDWSNLQLKIPILFALML